MSDVIVKKYPNADAGDEIGGFNRSRYEKLEVAFGVIADDEYAIGDVIIFSDVPALRVIEARITAHEDEPTTLEVVPGTDLSEALELAVTEEVQLSYVIHYIRGTGSAAEDGPGQLLQIEIVEAGT